MLRCALHINIGKNIYNFAILENLRIFQNCLFTGGVVTANGSCSAAFCESAALGGRTPSVSLRSPAPPRGRLCAMPETFPPPLKPSPWGRWLDAKRQDGRGTCLNSPSHRCAMPAPSKMGPLAWRYSFRLKCKVCGCARGSLPEGAGKAVGFD